MIKIYRIREDGSYKDFYCSTQKEADEKLKFSNFTDKAKEPKTKLKKSDMIEIAGKKLKIQMADKYKTARILGTKYLLN